MRAIHKKGSQTLVGGLLTLWLLMTACSGPLGKEEYMAWVQSYENGLHQQKTVGDYMFDVQYEPPAYVLLRENKAGLNAENYAQLLKEVEGLQYYTLKIGVTEKGKNILNWKVTSFEEYQQRRYYFSYLFQQAIYLEEDSEKIPCKLFLFENASDLKDERTFLLGFKTKSQQESGKTIVIDSEVFKTGAVKIKFEEQTLPELKL